MSGPVPHIDEDQKAERDPPPEVTHAPRNTAAGAPAASSIDALLELSGVVARLLVAAPAFAQAAVEAPIVGVVARSMRDIYWTTSEMATGTRAALRGGENGVMVMREAVVSSVWLVRSTIRLAQAGSRSLRR